MLFIYSIILSFGFLLMLPMFLLRREKYASGLRERLGNYPEFKHDGRKVIWLHCVSVGETNAARPLVDSLPKEFPNHRLVVSTTTKTGQELARKIFADQADAIFYFPFDFKFSVRRALQNFKPSLVLLMETEIWPRFIREAKRSEAKIAIVNGRLSQRSFDRYSRVRSFVKRVLANVDLALMQTGPDAKRMSALGVAEDKVFITGNLKFDQSLAESDMSLTEMLRARFAISPEMPLILAASTHEPEERYVIESLDGILGKDCRLLIAPRHPERFDIVERLLAGSSYSFVRRSSATLDKDRYADIILLDTIGELRAAYPLAEIVFVGGSLIPHGGQSVLEPAAQGKAILTGPHTHNFDEVIKEFVANDAIRQIQEETNDDQIQGRLNEEFVGLLENKELRERMGQSANALMNRAGRDATSRTLELLRRLV